MRYTIIVLNQVPKAKVVNGPQGKVVRKSTPPSFARPSTFIGEKPVYYDHSDLSSDDFTRRVELWEDSAGIATDEQIWAACPRLRDAVAQQIRMEGAFRLDQLAQPYQPTERDTWPTQLKEAEAFLSDPQAPTPMLDAIAAGRGMDKSALVELVMGNANLFRAAAGAILGQQQALLDRAYNTQSVADLLSIAWPAQGGA